MSSTNTSDEFDRETHFYGGKRNESTAIVQTSPHPLLCTALALAAAIFPGCAKSTEPDPDKPLVFRMGIVDGETSPVYAGARDIAENVERNTDGKIKIVVVTGGAW